MVRSVLPAEQMVLDQPVATWIWSVTPTSPGAKVLTLTLSPILKSDSEESVLGAKTFDREIVVAVAPKASPSTEPVADRGADSTGSGWSDLSVSVASGAILGVGGWMVKRWMRRRGSERDDPVETATQGGDEEPGLR